MGMLALAAISSPFRWARGIVVACVGDRGAVRAAHEFAGPPPFGRQDLVMRTVERRSVRARAVLGHRRRAGRGGGESRAARLCQSQGQEEGMPALRWLFSTRSRDS